MSEEKTMKKRTTYYSGLLLGVSMAMLMLPVGNTLGQNLLEKATFSVTASKAGEAENWVPEITFEKPTKPSSAPPSVPEPWLPAPIRRCTS